MTQSISPPPCLLGRLAPYEKAYEELSPPERHQFIQSAREELHKTRLKVIALGSLATIVTLVALPILAVLAVLISTGVLVIAPDSLFFPLVAGGVCAAGLGAYKLVQIAKNFFCILIFPSWQQANQIQAFLSQIPSESLGLNI